MGDGAGGTLGRKVPDGCVNGGWTGGNTVEILGLGKGGGDGVLRVEVPMNGSRLVSIGVVWRRVWRGFRVMGRAYVPNRGEVRVRL